VEVLALAVGATLGTRHFHLLSDGFPLVDAVAVAAIVACSLGIIAVVWSESRRLGQRAPAQAGQGRGEPE
jgi:hypothetical protein